MLAANEERARQRGVCNDCGQRGGVYMVHEHVWQQAWPAYLEQRAPLALKYADDEHMNTIWLDLCLPCLQVRLGRELSVEDFRQDLPVNKPLLFMYEMGRKLSSKIGHKKGEGGTAS